MAKLYGDIASSALMTFDKSFARANGQPLDSTEVYYSLTAAEEYAAGAGAYVGQKIVVVEDGVVTHYSIEDTIGTLKELGSKPVGDEKSITVAEDGTVSLVGIGTLVFERDILDEEDQPTGEKENVQYQPLMTKNGLVWVEPSKTTVEGLATLIDALTKRVEATEADIDALELAVGKEAEGETAATGLFKAIGDEVARATDAEGALSDRITTLEGKEDKDTTYSVKEGEKILSLDGTAFGTTLKLAYSDNKIKLLGIDDTLISEFDASVFVSDGVLEDASYDAEAKKITFTWNIITGTDENGNPIYKTDVVEIGDLVDTYTAGNGLNLNKDNEFSVKVTDSDKYLEVDATGVHTKGIDDAIDTAKQEAIDAASSDATTKANTAKSEAIADADGKLALKANTADVYNKSETYSQTEIDELLEGIQGGASESAASVNTKLEAFKKVTNLELYGNETGEGDSRLDTLEAVGAQANVLESVIAKEGSKITVSGIINKTVTIDDSALVELIGVAQTTANEAGNAASAAQTSANEAKASASDNASAIGELSTTVSGHTTTVNDHAGRITVLENANTAHATEYNTLKDIVTGHTTSIASKADQTALDTAVADIAKNTTAITTLNETTIPSINTEIAKKANATDVYTKAEVGTIAEGKTLVQMITDAQAEATYDDTAIKADIKKNTDAIAILNGDDQTEGSVDRKVALEVAKILNDNDSSDIDTLNEIAAWITNDTTGAAKMNADISANTAAITKLNGDADVEGSVLAMIKANAPTVATDTVLGVVLSSSAENKVSVAEDGTMSVNSINVNKLTQTSGEVLVLNGGSANA